MHGPYHARVQIQDETLVLREDDLVEGDRIADRFYQGLGVRVVDGANRAAVFTAALVLEPGMEAEVEIVGFDGSGRSEREVVCRRERVRRDERGRLLSTLGSRFHERVFKGV